MKPSLPMGWDKRRIEVGETPLYRLRLIERDQDVGEMCKYVPGVREIEMYLEHLSPKEATLKHKLLMNLDENALLKKCVIIEDIEESRVAISITRGSGSKLKKGRAKRGADDLEKRLCLLNDIAYNGDDEHEAEATEGGQGSGDEAENGPLNADDEGDETEEGHEAEEVNEGTEVEANEGF
ncbi:hypothetical protein DVH24_007976 [Malus domestica]|uniref:Uncharacterized protein n=1 Tax=Malus domestica TaxID=3750 RepID=A0A498JKA5_MALDO|nr:hypothetical protein DVH24_007976 [Malus domestica]